MKFSDNKLKSTEMLNLKEAEEWATNAYRDNSRYSAGSLKYTPSNLNFALIVIAVFYLAFYRYSGLVIILNIISFSYFLYRFILTVVGLGSLKSQKKVEYKSVFVNNEKEVQYRFKKDDFFSDMGAIPKYAIFLPCRNENLGVINKLIENINAINYPKEKLDIILLIDEDDKYLSEIKKLTLPSHFRTISASANFPFTKPKVTNLGLYLTDAKYGVIYDAEDKPHPNQLLDVLQEFKKDKELVCVQCRLHYANKKNNILTRFFNLEYLTWFGLTIHGLAKSQFSKYPFIPLGGTSNHYDLNVIKSMNGHDAYNVTEDAALGVHFALENKKIKTINSVTDELAVDELWTWIKQRTRWNLGHLITYVVFSRNFRENLKKLGLIRYLNFMIILLGNFLVPFIAPLLFIIFALDFFDYCSAGIFVGKLAYITLIGNYILIVLSHAIASLVLQKGKNIFLSFLQPFYYLLHSIASWRALYKFFTAPTVWEKTIHKETAEFDYFNENFGYLNILKHKKELYA